MTMDGRHTLRPGRRAAPVRRRAGKTHTETTIQGYGPEQADSRETDPARLPLGDQRAEHPGDRLRDAGSDPAQEHPADQRRGPAGEQHAADLRSGLPGERPADLRRRPGSEQHPADLGSGSAGERPADLRRRPAGEQHPAELRSGSAGEHPADLRRGPAGEQHPAELRSGSAGEHPADLRSGLAGEQHPAPERQGAESRPQPSRQARRQRIRATHTRLMADAGRRAHRRGCARGPLVAHLATVHAQTWRTCAADCPWPEPEAEATPVAARGSRLSRWVTLALLILIPIVSSLSDVFRPAAAAQVCPGGQVTMAAAGGDVVASLESKGGSVLLHLCTTGGTVTRWAANATPREGGAALSFALVPVGEGAAIGTAVLPAGREWLLAVEVLTETGELRYASSYVAS